MEKKVSPTLSWPTFAAASARAVNEMLEAFATIVRPPAENAAHGSLDWTTPNSVILELPTLRLHRFTTAGKGSPTLVVTPFALHNALVADFAQGHSLVQALARGGVGPMYLIEWRSATPAMRFNTIDTMLADFNVAVDEIGRTNLVGICQGGWMSVLYAARFPRKLRKLVVVAAPVDVHAGESPFSRSAKAFPTATLSALVNAGDGLVRGADALRIWSQATANVDRSGRTDLQISQDRAHPWSSQYLARRFRDWNVAALDLPGSYYLEVAERLYHDNQIANGTFVALGKTINLRDIRAPVFLLAARDDQIVAVGQLLAARGLLGTPPDQVAYLVVRGSHLSLFMGRRTLARVWPRIAAWLQA